MNKRPYDDVELEQSLERLFASRRPRQAFVENLGANLNRSPELHLVKNNRPLGALLALALGLVGGVLLIWLLKKR